MTIHLQTVAKLAKSFAVKREKTSDDTESVVAHLKFGDCVIDRDQLDELLGQPIGWSQGSLFDELGAPRARVTLSLNASNWSATGLIRGGDKPASPSLRIKEAELDSVALELAPHGALLSAQLSWAAEGDEVDDIADMLGAICGVDLVLTDGGQGDLLGKMLGAGFDSVEIRDGDGNLIAKRTKREAA